MKLDQLKKGNKAVIIAINTSQKIKNRLFALGMINGRNILFLQTAPLGDPYLYQISGNLLVIRKSIASKIEVTLQK